MSSGTAHAMADASPSTWIWFGVVTGGLLLATVSLSLVPQGQRRVVIRGGLVRRVVESGIAWRIPILERSEPVLAMAHDVPLAVRATTIDGVPVVVLVETVVTIRPPAPGRRYADPWPAAEEQVEAEIRSLVSRLPVVQLTHALRAAEGRLLASIGQAVRVHGVELESIEVVEVDLPLASDHGPG